MAKKRATLRHEGTKKGFEVCNYSAHLNLEGRYTGEKPFFRRFRRWTQILKTQFRFALIAEICVICG
jgi:hypothetical protein